MEQTEKEMRWEDQQGKGEGGRQGGQENGERHLLGMSKGALSLEMLLDIIMCVVLGTEVHGC